MYNQKKSFHLVDTLPKTMLTRPPCAFHLCSDDEAAAPSEQPALMAPLPAVNAAPSVSYCLRYTNMRGPILIIFLGYFFLVQVDTTGLVLVNNEAVPLGDALYLQRK